MIRLLVVLFLLSGCIIRPAPEIITIREPCALPCAPGLDGLEPSDSRAAWCLSLDDMDLFADWLEQIYLVAGGCNGDD